MITAILQTPSTRETRAVHVAVMVHDHLRAIHAPLDGLRQHARHLADGTMPVGSVEFVRAAMAIAGIAEPANLSYPDAGAPYLHRSIRKINVRSVTGPCFVKPVVTKQFTGFVWPAGRDMSSLCAHDREQHQALVGLPDAELVWVSDVVYWLSEWRYYVAHGEIIGYARYDPSGYATAPEPDRTIIRDCIRALAFDHPYALDFGVMADGRTALVEVNDAWALDLYGDAMAPRTYFEYLRLRWRILFGGKP